MARSVRLSWRSKTYRRHRWTSCTCATSTSLSRRARESCSLFPSRRSMSWREQRSPATSFPTAEYRELIDELAANPARMRVLNEPERYDPEQVFYIKGLKRAPDGLVHFMLLRREGDAFEIAWDPETMPHTIRWILDNGDQRVAAFAMPATCEPEGYTAEKRKGNVRILPSGAMARFVTRIGYVDKASAASAARSIEGSADDGDGEAAHRRRRQQHGRPRDLCEAHAGQGRDRRGAELRDGARRKGRQPGRGGRQARSVRRHGHSGRRRHVRRQHDQEFSQSSAWTRPM